MPLLGYSDLQTMLEWQVCAHPQHECKDWQSFDLLSAPLIVRYSDDNRARTSIADRICSCDHNSVCPPF